MDQYIGKLLDNRYEILECIGAGGMARVYKARDHRLNRLVAVKILKPELANDAEFRRRFHDESQAVAMLSHPNIVAVYDVSRSDDVDYIVMELIEGITLKQYMQKKGLPLNWREALHFITQIIKALGHAHSRGIIHRDIKPQNIMVLRDGSVKVADFGIARLASAAQSTLTQGALGSVHYISPEQARGSHIDARSDLYSAGVVLYEMTAGRLPYEGDTPVSVAIQHISSIPLPPRDVNPDVPEALEAITMKAMASDADKRYVSAEAMLVDLEEFRKNPNINFEYTQEDLFPEGAAGVVDEPTLIRTGENIAAVPPRRRRSEREPEEYDDYDDRRRGSVWPVILAVVAILAFIGVIAYFLWTTIFGSILGDTGTEHIVPNLIGMTIEEAEREIRLGAIDDVFVIQEGRVLESDLPAGQIINQDPAPKEKKKGDKIVITVDVSQGQEQDLMPHLVNEDYRILDQLQLEAKGYIVTRVYENSSSVTRDYIIRATPAEGTVLQPGQEITVVISKGPENIPVIIPSFIGQSIEWAQRTAQDQKLVLEIEERENETVKKGIVLDQSIPAYTEVEEGATITLIISSGPVEEIGSGGNDPGLNEPPEPTPPVESDPPVEPSQPPEPTPPVVSDVPALPVTKTISVNLSDYFDYDTVTLRVAVGGEEQYNSSVNPAMSPVAVAIRGTGQQQVVVYVDGVLYESYTVDFGQ